MSSRRPSLPGILEPRTSQTHPVHISWLIPPELLVDPQNMQRALLGSNKNQPEAGRDLLDYILENPSSSSADDNKHITHKLSGINFSEHLQVDQDETGINGVTPVLVASLEEHHQLPSKPGYRWNNKWMGNICLSGCPGKKVRLDTGPVNGRAMVNRDLDDDFKRLREFDVECAVCCIDNEELKFLGADWPKYSAAAKRCHIEVLRLPIAEGFPPATIAEAHALVKQIDERLMSGKNILIHCRGGIGRAGVIACCLLLYKGLVRTPAHAVQLLRIRRSPKGIETPTQAAFLIDYTRWLHTLRATTQPAPPVLTYKLFPHVSQNGKVTPPKRDVLEIENLPLDLRRIRSEELNENISTVKNIDQTIYPTPVTAPRIPESYLQLSNALSISWVRSSG